MKTSRTYNAIRNMLSGGLNQLASILLPFVLRTAIIYYFGVNFVGLKTLFSSILNVLNVTELGIGGVIAALLYKPIAEKDEETINILINYLKRCYRILGAAILVMGMCMLFYLKDIIAKDYPKEINIYILYILNLLSTVISYFLFAYKKVLLSAHQRYDIEVNISTIIIIIQTILQIVVIAIWKNFYLFTLILPMMTILNNLITNYIINSKFSYNFYKIPISIKLKQNIFSKVAGAFWYKLGGVILFSVDNIVISGFLGLIILGEYSNYYYIMSLGQGLQAMIHNSIRPIIGNQLASSIKEKNQIKFFQINFVYMFFSGVSAICLFCLLQPFILLWLGSEMLMTNKLVILIVINFYAQSCCHMFRIYQEAAGIFKEGKFIPLLGAMVNLVLNLLCIKTFQLYGVVVSTIISVIFVLLPGYIWIIWKHYFQTRTFIWKTIKTLISYTLATAIIGVVCFFICNHIFVTGWWGFVIKTVSCVIIAFLLYMLFFLHSDEEKYFKNSLIKVAKRCYRK